MKIKVQVPLLILTLGYEREREHLETNLTPSVDGRPRQNASSLSLRSAAGCRTTDGRRMSAFLRGRVPSPEGMRDKVTNFEKISATQV